MGLSNINKFIIASAVCIGLLIFLCIFSLVTYSKQKESFKWLEHSYLVLNQAESMMYGLQGAESHVRAFVITNDKSNVLSFNHSLYRAETALDSLLILTFDNVNQQRRLNALNMLLKERKSLFYEDILHRKDDVKEELIFFKEVTMQGDKKMGEIKKIITAMENEEQWLLKERKRNNESISLQLFRITLLLIIFSLTIGIAAVFYIGKDIRYRKKTEEELKSLDKNKNRFFSIISHDLKGPAGGILKLSEFLLNDAFAKDHKEIAKRLNMSAKNHYTLLENLLSWSRSQMGKQETKKEIIDINKLVLTATAGVSYLANEKEVEVNSNLPTYIQAWGDYNMILTVVRNLLQNAIKFTPHHGKVTVSAKNTGNFTEVSVTDTGIGMTKEYLERLFKIESTFTLKGTDEEEGTGMGLLLCKEFIEKNGGTIKATSKPGDGATFTFTIPKQQIS